MCDALTLSNGQVSYDRIERVQGTKASHKCKSGYELVGISVRRCTSLRTWSGNPPTCKGIIISIVSV